ncbi:MAG: HK97 family phage prohead protease [Brevundimonas sp.]|jgi:HK97 family phage prohead protease|uniref:HK97 family phage prohead protease n=1 Tax=Brevundimonas sp. TaxID=1871086 RepID=UPI00391F529F
MTLAHGPEVTLDLKSVTEAGIFTGYASTFGNVDRVGDIVAAGAFRKSLSRRPAAQVKMLRGHDTAEPIGVWTELEEDGRGLKATGRLILDTTKGRETYALMKAGALDGLSIGFRAVKAGVERKSGARVIQEADLLEISVVTFPANPQAAVRAVKSHTPDHAQVLIRALERAHARLRAERS